MNTDNKSLFIFGDSHGMTLLEFLISTLLISLISIILYSALFGLIRQQAVIKDIYQEIYAYMRFKRVIRDVVGSLDQHRLLLLPRIHRNNNIRHTDNSSNQIMHAAGNRVPAVGSDALTSLAIATLNTHDVVELTLEANQLLAIACPRFENGFNGERFRSFLGISIDGMTELRGSTRSVRQMRPCREFTLTSVSKSMLLDQADSLANIRVIIPIERQTTVYLDHGAEVRLLTHDGKRNIANQPMFSKVSSMHFSLQPAVDNSIFLLSGSIRFPSKREYRVRTATQLGRSKHYNFLLN